MYGPSVMPWQPDGIWLSPYNGEYVGEEPGRGSIPPRLYTYWKRTAPYPSMMTFDGGGKGSLHCSTNQNQHAIAGPGDIK